MTVRLLIGTVGDILLGEAKMTDVHRGEPVWRRSRRCADAACVEVRNDGDGRVLLRSTLSPETVLSLTADEWSAFRAGVTRGDFD